MFVLHVFCVSIFSLCGVYNHLMAASQITLTEKINDILPQTQCGKCGYDGCKPYAEALAAGSADINQCPPGGEAGIRKLAALLGREFKPLNPEFGVEKPRATAFIEEGLCIGCVKCIDACPVDAIIGASKQMHTVITDHCTGCELCLAPCPVDCITMIPAANPVWSAQDAAAARQRFDFRNARLSREHEENEMKLAGQAAKKDAIQATLKRIEARRAARSK
ncbi:MAG: electron transport complex subunit RsxB [Burkholderiales bacterium]